MDGIRNASTHWFWLQGTSNECRQYDTMIAIEIRIICVTKGYGMSRLKLVALIFILDSIERYVISIHQITRLSTTPLCRLQKIS